MASLDSSSTLAQIKACYADNGGYAEDASATMALAFITACRLLLIKLPKRVGQRSGDELELDLAVIADQMTAAQRWLAGNAAVTAGGAGVKHVDFTDFRS